MMMREISILFVSWNLIVALIYALDKSKARRSARRIRESTLILLSFFLGGVGAMFGMVWFNHKTSKLRFRLLVPLGAIITVAAYVGVIFFASSFKSAAW